MTATTDTAGHPDVAEISDLTEGLLSPSRTADVQRHLEQCELCADVYASLEEIRDLLGVVPGPPRMPADVAGRIDAALAAEALLNATAPDDTSAAPRARETLPVSGAPDSAHVSRETSATADRPVGHARSSTAGPGRKNRKKAGRRKVAVLSAAFTAAALGLGSVLLTSLMGGGAGPTADGGQTATDTFSAAKLETQVADLLAKNESSPGSSQKPDRSLGTQGGPDTKSPQILREITVPECVRKGIGRDDLALATEEGVYKGKDALLVVLPHATNDSRVTVYVMDATCVRHPSSTKAKILLQESYARS